MSQLKDDTKFSELSIPGTHDTGTKNIASSLIGKTQSLDVTHQLQNGIRFLDIRAMVTSEGKFNIYHDMIDAHLTFDEVLEDLVSFLKQNPGETVYLKLQQENSSASDEYFNQILMDYINQEEYTSSIYTRSSAQNPDNPRLGETRGKIVFLKRFYTVIDSLKEIGLDYGGENFDIQDNYDQPTTEQKISDVENQLIKANQHATSDKIYLNYLSAYKLGQIENYARAVNPAALSVITSHSLNHTGIVISDFPGDQLINRIIDLNWKNAKEGFVLYHGASIVLRTAFSDNNDAVTWNERNDRAVSISYQERPSQEWVMVYDATRDAYKFVNCADSSQCLGVAILQDKIKVVVSKDIDAVEQYWKISGTSRTNVYGQEVKIRPLLDESKILTVMNKGANLLEINEDRNLPAPFTVFTLNTI